MLLCEFRKARDAKYCVPDYWKAILGENPRVSINRFRSEGLLEIASVTETLPLILRLPELKQMLKQRDLPVSGKKDILIERLLSSDLPFATQLVDTRPHVKLSPEGQSITDKYCASKDKEKADAVAEVLPLLRLRNFKAAGAVVAAYQAKQIGVSLVDGVASQSGRLTPQHYSANLDSIFSSYPTILQGLSSAEWEQAHLCLAIGEALGHWDNSLPDHFTGAPRLDSNTAMRMISFHCRHIRELKQLRRIGVKKITIEGCGDSASCASCKKISGKKFSLDGVPELPYAKCTSAMGCRCLMLADFD
jgi:hypothetical protein